MDTGEPDGPRVVTRADVAARAGVSGTVVSYVLTGTGRVGEATAARVRAAVAELGYRPNRSARALRSGTSELIGVVVTDITNPFFAEFALEVELAAAERGRAALIVNSLARLENELSLIEDLADRGAEGLVIASVLPAHSRNVIDGLETPVVWLDDFDAPPGRPTLGSSLVEGAERVVTHLVEVHGRRRVGLAVGDGYRTKDDPRQVGWLRALRAAGLPPGPVAMHSWRRSGGLTGGRELLGSPEPPDAVFACSDLIGAGVLRAAADLGIDVPGEVSVASFDGTQAGGFTVPRLTTMRQPVAAMARAAVDALLSEEGLTESRHFPGELWIGESCGCRAVTGPESGRSDGTA